MNFDDITTLLTTVTDGGTFQQIPVQGEGGVFIKQFQYNGTAGWVEDQYSPRRFLPRYDK